MKKMLAVSAVALAGVLATPLTAHAIVVNPSGTGYCEDGEEPSAVSGPGPAAKKDRNDNGWVCIHFTKQGYRFVDDTLI